MGQIEEIEERVLSLSDILRSPLRKDDHSERARRELLCRFVRFQRRSSPLHHSRDIRRRLMDIFEKLEPLSEQNGRLKFWRNEDHVGFLNGFVQDAARAVMDYQVRDWKCALRCSS